MADGQFPGLISRDRDVNAKDNAIYVNLTDDAGASIGVTGTSLNVNLTNSTIAVTQSGTWTIDSITNDVSIDDGGNSITVDGTVSISGTVTVSATDLDIRDLSASQDNVAISDGTEQLEINTDGSINVNVVSAVSADEIHDYDTATVAGDGTDNHDYTVANATFLLKSVIFSSSGDGKFEIQTDNGGGLATVCVGFTNGKQGDTRQVNFDPAIEATTSIRVIRTNRENQSQDVYSTIIGRDI